MLSSWSKNWFVVKYLLDGPIKIAKSLVIDPFSTHSMQTFSNNFENLIYNELNQLSFKSKKITNKIVNNHILFEKNNIITTGLNGNIIV